MPAPLGTNLAKRLLPPFKRGILTGDNVHVVHFSNRHAQALWFTGDGQLALAQTDTLRQIGARSDRSAQPGCPSATPRFADLATGSWDAL